MRPATIARKRNEIAREREIAHLCMLLRVIDQQIEYLRTTPKTISLHEFRKMQAERQDLTRRIASARLEADDKAYAHYSFVSRYRGRPVLRLIQGGKQR